MKRFLRPRLPPPSSTAPLPRWLDARPLSPSANRPPKTPTTQKSFLLYVDGGAWCYDISTCAKRAKTRLGSAYKYATGAGRINWKGLLSSDPRTNPIFARFHMLYFPYCDGASFTGDAAQPAGDEAHRLWFRGRVFDELLQLSLEWRRTPTRDRSSSAARLVGTVVALFFAAAGTVRALLPSASKFAAVTGLLSPHQWNHGAVDAEATGRSASAATTFSSICRSELAGRRGRRVRTRRGEGQGGGLAVGRAKANLEVANRGCIYLSLLTLYAWGGYLVSSGALPVGALIASVGYTFGLVFATQGVVNTAADFKAAGSALRRVRELCTSQEPDEAQLWVP